MPPKIAPRPRPVYHHARTTGRLDMQICRTIPQARASAAAFRQDGATLALVPTMGALHAGHLSLIDRARTEASRVIVSILVNPTQFGPTDGFAAYPRPLDQDLTLLRAARVDAVFLPEVADLYPHGAQTIVEPPEMARLLLGKLHPGHFRGVATVVNKLFNIWQPDVACFGEKDYQQLCVIRQMVRDLHLPLRICAVPAMRDGDGLVMSSRNARLTPEDRTAALVLGRTLIEAQAMARTGITASRLRAWIAATIQSEPRADLQSADIRDAQTLEPVSGTLTAPAVILLSVRFGTILLTDQCIVCG